MADLLPDGTFDFRLGQDSWTDPDRIQPNQYSRGINVTTRGGVLGPRYGLHSQTLTFENNHITTRYRYERTIKEIWASGKYQAAVAVMFGSDEYIITVIAGLVFQTHIESMRTILLSDTVRVNQYAARINWAYASGYVILFDFPAHPVIVDANSIQRADPEKNEIPISTLGTYSQYRLLIGDAGVQYVASDAVGNSATPFAPLTFNELLTPNATFFDQWFSLPVEDAQMPITAMGHIQQIDTSTGIGPTFLGTQKKVYSVRTDLPREQWGGQGFSSVLLDNAGICGQRGFTNVNSDVIFITPEAKIHAFTTARNESQRWGNVPMSVEVENFLKDNGPQLNSLMFAGYFANHIFVSANIFRTKALTVNSEPITDYAAGGFVVLELDSLSTFLNEGTPVWAGLWTGVRPMDIISADKRCFVISKDSGINQLYEMDKRSTVDRVRGNKRRVNSVVYTKEYTHENSYLLKKERSISMHLQHLRGKVEVAVEKKPSHATGFLPYGKWDYEAPTQAQGKKIAGAYAPHEFRELTFGGSDQENLCNPITKDSFNVYAGVQLRLTIKADSWKLKDIKLNADVVSREERQEAFMCEQKEKVLIPQQFDPDWVIEEDSICP